MRILHLPSSYFPDTLGGTEMYVRQLADELMARGHTSHVVWHSETRELPEGSVTLPPMAPRGRRAVYRHSNDCDPPGFEQLLRDLRPDLVHFHAFTMGAGLDHARVARRAGVPYVITFHTPTMACARGTWLLDGNQPCDGVLNARRCSACVLGEHWPASIARGLSASPLQAAVLPDGPWLTHLARPSLLASAFEAWHEFFGGAQQVVACAQFVAERLVRNGVVGERVSVLRQALPGPTRERQLRTAKITASRPLRLGFFGRITMVKGPDLLVQAAQRLRSAGTPAEVELAGPAPGRRLASSQVDRGYARGVSCAATPLAACDTGPGGAAQSGASKRARSRCWKHGMQARV